MACNKRRLERRRTLKRKAKRTPEQIAASAAYWRKQEEDNIALMERTKPKHIRTPQYVREEPGLQNASLERAAIPKGVSDFWHKWLYNPDNLCTREALDAAGWGVTITSVTPEEGGSYHE